MPPSGMGFACTAPECAFDVQAVVELSAVAVPPLLRDPFIMPRMNSIMERRVRTCRRELLDRTLIWNQRHLLHALREYERFYNLHRPHQGIANARPLAVLPTPIAEPGRLAQLNIHRHDRLGGILHEYEHAA
jgi:putative transposase